MAAVAALAAARTRGSRIAGEAIVAVGVVIGWLRPYTRFLPGIGGAAAVSVAVGEIAGHLWGHGLAPWVSLLVAGFFALRLDGRITITITPRGRG